MAAGPLELWNHWSVHILVLLSLGLQIVLFLFAGIRRREAHLALRLLLWVAYQLADFIAISALGHLSLAPRDHRLAEFWAPFLMLHLGGPDNITAYALQDNQLWQRHLQILVVQVLGAAYVLYKQIAGNGSFFLLAAVLMFATGVVKYAERTWALRRGTLGSIRSSFKKEPLAKHHQFHALDHGFREEALAPDEEELYVRRAHSLFHVCKRAMVDSWIEKDPENHGVEMLSAIRNEDYEGMWVLMEMELSLMYDILYTKAAVIHTWCGYCIRVASPLAAAASFVLFHFSGKDGHMTADVAVTYTLLSGALLLETASLLAALASSWTYSYLCATGWSGLRYAALCTGRWDRLRWLVKAATARRGRGQARRWSGEMGQYNMLHLCSRPTRVPVFSPLLGRLAKMVRQQELWIRKHYSGTVHISDDLRQRLFDYIKGLPRSNEVNTQGVIRKSWGQHALETHDWLYNDDSKKEDDLKKKEDDLKKKEDFKITYFGAELQEAIIVWHIATDVFLVKSSQVDYKPDAVKAIKTLSNYMMFLLVERPDMLPGLAQTRLYQRTCKNLFDLWRSKASRDHPDHRNVWAMLKELFQLRDDPSTSRLKQREDLAISLHGETQIAYSIGVPRLAYAKWLSDKLLRKEKKRGTSGVHVDVVKVLLDVWMDFLVYAANRCSRESHAKKLSSGGELTTVLWLMADYFHQDFLNRVEQTT